MARNQKLFNSFAVFIALISAGLTGCTKKNEAGSVRISVPTSVKSTSQKTGVTTQSTTTNWNTAINPTVGSDINCYAVFVAGAGLETSTCQFSNAGATSTIKFGPFVGFLSPGSNATIEVPPGSDRVFHVVGFRASTAAACASVVLPGDVDSSLFSEPFVIASQLAEIPPGPSSLTIQPTLDLQKKILDCKIAGSSGTTGGGGGGGSSGGIISWGDKRDGALNFHGTLPRLITVGAVSIGENVDTSFTPQVGGVNGSKTFGASRQVTNIDTTTGQILTLGSAFSAYDFEVGDEVLWYVSAGNSPTSPDDQDVGACGSTLYRGSYGTAIISATAGATVTLASKIADTPAKIKNANLTAPITATDFCRVSLHRIPNFDQITVDAGAIWTLTAAPYVASTGTEGVIVLRAGRLEVNGNLKIDGTGKGYEGGFAKTSGGSVAGLGVFNSYFANSSGGGSSSTASGAGGAGAGQGGHVGVSSFGGAPLNYCENSTYASIASGSSFTCGVVDDGELKCWGSGISGTIGDGSYSTRYVPSAIASSLKFTQVSTGQSHTCAIDKVTNRLYCWGYNNFGQLGDGTVIDHLTPELADGANTYKAVAVANYSTCGLTTGGAIRCWGYGLDGELGNSLTVNSSTPVTADAGTVYESISAGGKHVCAITTGGVLKCWGDNTSGKLGDGTLVNRLEPTIVGAGYMSVSAGKGNATCATTTAGIAKCWGNNSAGQLGDGTLSNHVLPMQVAGALTFKSVAVGLLHSCGLTTDQHLACWGENSYGAVGDGTLTSRLTPTPIDPTTTFSAFSSSAFNSCALTTTGQPKCWGQNTYGQIGNGSVGGYTMVPTGALTQRTCMPLSNQKAFFGGGGGGSGSTHTGASGGGLVLVFAKEITGTGTLTVISNGFDGTGMAAAVASGGGGGGVVALATRLFKLQNVNVIAGGGIGFNPGGNSSGGGGGGSIEIKYCAVESIAVAVATLVTDAKGGLGFTGSDPGALGRIERGDTTSTCSYY